MFPGIYFTTYTYLGTSSLSVELCRELTAVETASAVLPLENASGGASSLRQRRGHLPLSLSTARTAIALHEMKPPQYGLQTEQNMIRSRSIFRITQSPPLSDRKVASSEKGTTSGPSSAR